MQAVEQLGFDEATVPQVRELVRTIIDAATALARLLPNEELEQGFEFPWGHSNSSRVVEMPEFKPKTRAKKSEILDQPLEGRLALYVKEGLLHQGNRGKQHLSLPRGSLTVPESPTGKTTLF